MGHIFPDPNTLSSVDFEHVWVRMDQTQSLGFLQELQRPKVKVFLKKADGK